MTTSVWNQSIRMPSYTALHENIDADITVIGGGLGGVLTAYLLQKAGRSVCLIEAGKIGSGQTGLTTAEFTSVLDTRYFELEKLHGTRGAALAAQSHLKALDMIEEIVNSESIFCEFERVPGYLFASQHDDQIILEKEWRAMLKAGIRDVNIVHSIPNVFFNSINSTALRLADQIQLHPLKLLKGLVEAFTQLGGKVFTETRATEIHNIDLPIKIKTDKDHHIFCNSLVVATNSPMNNTVAIHTKQSAYRSYVLGFEIEKGSIPRYLFWDTEEPYHYVRVQDHPTHDSLDVLIVGGEDHKTGQEEHPEKCFEHLTEWTGEKFKIFVDAKWKWSGQVMEPIDGLAFLGKNPNSSQTYIITGHSGNGMSFCTIGAMLIRDEILGIKNEWEELYNPSRKNMHSISEFIAENSNTMAQYYDWLSKGEVKSVDEIQKGEGAILREGFQLIAAYRNEDGEIELHSAACPHLEGAVRWNSVEKTWDCPCHGSRFDCHGKMIEGPAYSDLKAHDEKAPQPNPLFIPTEQITPFF